MNAALTVDRTDAPGITLAGVRFVDALHTEFPRWKEAGAASVTTPWEAIEGSDDLGSYRGFRSQLVRDGQPLLVQTIRTYGPTIVFSVQPLHPIAGIARRDAYETPAIHAPRFTVADRLRMGIATYGLGASDDPHGGYWPSAAFFANGQLPTEAFAPLVVYDDACALAVAPASHFLSGALVAVPGGVARGIHGSIDRLDLGTVLETIFAVGTDPADALMALGDVLLRRSGKRRPDPSSHVSTRTLGWWNAYGGYFTEPIRPLDAQQLKAVLEKIGRRDLPIGYLGLDLWYPYTRIGQAIEFVPDPRKYPQGVGEIVRAAGLPAVLHLSALAQPNAYGSNGADGSVYEAIGDEVRRQGGSVVWHDWMRTQQHLTPQLRSHPAIADRWYRRMTEAFAERGLEMFQCMHTMGMALASTEAPNVRAARTSIDYLFALPEAIATLSQLGENGFRREALPAIDLYRQNLLMGMFLYALGLLPFHDLFLTRFHRGIGGSHPQQDAVLRALSCGPVGIGDAPDRADERLLQRLVLPDGRLLRPDRPPFPVFSTVEQPIETYWTLHDAGEATWLYVLLLNRTSSRQGYHVLPPIPGRYVVCNGFDGTIVDRIAGELDAADVAYYVLSPIVEGIAPLGLVDKLVPAPAGRFVSLEHRSGLELHLDGVCGTIAVWSEQPIDAEIDGRRCTVQRFDAVSTVSVAVNDKTLALHRRCPR